MTHLQPTDRLDRICYAVAEASLWTNGQPYENGWPYIAAFANAYNMQVGSVFAGIYSGKLAGDEELVRFFTTIGDATELSDVRLRLALRLNTEMAHGAIGVRDDHLVMTDTLLLKDADADEIAASVSYLAETADYYEKQLYGTDEH